MDYSKVLYVKFEDADKLAEAIKTIMKNDDMDLAQVDGNEYRFDRFGDYSRTFVVRETQNEWNTIIDNDTDHTEELGQALSKELSCFVLCIGIYKDVLTYTVCDNGEQSDQYISSLKYYEYEVDDDVREMYSGNAGAFNRVMEEEKEDALKEVMDKCRVGEIEPGEAAFSIQRLLGIIQYEENEKENNGDEDQGEADSGDHEDVEIVDLFYVDFKSINIKTDSDQDIITAVREICKDMGYVEVKDFSVGEEQKKGFFRKILNSVKEEKQVEFFISPSVNGWITLIGELEKLFGGEPSDWDFLHIEDKLSEMLDTKVVLISADSEMWGFSIFQSGQVVYKYSSTDKSVYIEDINEVLPEMNEDAMESIFDREIFTPQDIDEVLGEFCGLLGIRNYRINIPMDYSEEEFIKDVINKLPDGEQFTNLKFIEEK